MRQPARRFGFIAVLALAASSHGADQDPDAALEQVIVQGSRIRLDALRKEAVAAEVRFYDRYNELNRDDDFDVHCRTEASIGTRIASRTCRAAYQEEALREEGEMAFEIKRLRDPRNGAAPPTTTPMPAAVRIEARRPEFQQNMRRVLASNAELQRLLAARAQAVERLHAEQKRLFGKEGASDAQMTHGSGDSAVPATPAPRR